MNTIIRTKKGLLEGVNAGAYTVYKGVPYAKPPTGELRFRAPQEPDAWDGVKKRIPFQICVNRSFPHRTVHLPQLIIKNFTVIRILYRL